MILSGYLDTISKRKAASVYSSLHCLEAHQQGERLQAEVATVDEIAKEDEVLIATTRNLVDTNCRVSTGTSTTARLTGCTGASTGLLFIVVILTASALDAAVRATDLLLELWVRNLRGRLNIIRTDDSGLRSGLLDIGFTWHPTSDSEELQQIVELTMDITADRDRSTDRLDVGLWTKVSVIDRAMLVKCEIHLP